MRMTKRVEVGAREDDIEAVVWMRHTIQLETSGSRVISLLANFNSIASLRYRPAGGIAKGLVVLGP